MSRCILVFSILFLMAGCASADYAVSRAAEAFDKGLEGAQWFTCEGASIGSVRRAYNTPEAAEIYREFCNLLNRDVDVIGSKEPS